MSPVTGCMTDRAAPQRETGSRILRRAATQALIESVGEPIASAGFEDVAWLFTCDSRNRGLIRQGFDEAALLWKAVSSTSGNILEIGRNLAGSTVLLAAASEPDREIYSIDNRSNEQPACKDFLARPENKRRVHLLVADSRKSLPDLRFGLLFIDGDHTFEGVLADVVAHWNSAHDAALVAFHDALPNDNFKWRDADRRWKRFSIRLKNKFRKTKKPEIGPAHEPGVLKVCNELIRQGFAEKWGAAASMFVLKKIADLPPDFSERVRNP
jgi:predicted O-methyltransferase YrrM